MGEQDSKRSGKRSYKDDGDNDDGDYDADYDGDDGCDDAGKRDMRTAPCLKSDMHIASHADIHKIYAICIYT